MIPLDVPHTAFIVSLMVLLSATVIVLPVEAQQPVTHELLLEPANVHWGYFDARQPAVLRIRSGDFVRLQTLVARGLERPRLLGLSDSDFHPGELAVEAAITTHGPGAHPMTGPIWVEGAEPGDALEVRIEEVEPLTEWGV